MITTLVLGFMTLIAFALYEALMPLKQPLLPVKLFKIRTLVAVVFVGSVGQMVYYALNVLWPIQITGLFTTNNITIGLMSSTTGTALAMGEFVFSPLFRTVGRPKWQLFLAAAGTGLFAVLMALVTPSRKGMALAFTILAGLFVGWIELVAITIAGLVVPPNDMGVGQGFFASTRAVTGTIAGESKPSDLIAIPLTNFVVSIYVCIYSNRLTAYLPQDIVPAVEAAGLPASSIAKLFAAIAKGTPAAIEAVPGVNAKVLAALTTATQVAYAHAFKIVYLSTLGFTAVAITASLFVGDIDKYLTNYVNKTIHKPHVHAEKHETTV